MKKSNRMLAALSATTVALAFPLLAQADVPVSSAPVSPDMSVVSQTVSYPTSDYPNGFLTFTLTPRTETAVSPTRADALATGVSANKLTCATGGDAGEVKYKNWGISVVTLWTYASIVIFRHCSWVDSTGVHGKVTKVLNLFDEAVDTCCNWGWHGDVLPPQHSWVPAPTLSTYTKGEFAACLPWPISYCNEKYPWVRLKVNGFGQHIGFSWGIG